MKYVRSLLLLATFAISHAILGMEVIPATVSTGSSSTLPQIANKIILKTHVHNMQHMTTGRAMTYLYKQARFGVVAKNMLDRLRVFSGGALLWIDVFGIDILSTASFTGLLREEYRVNVVSCLLHDGFDPNFVNKDHKTPLLYAVLGCYGKEILPRLLAYGANPLIADAHGISPLMYATYRISNENKIYGTWQNREAEQALLKRAEDAWRAGKELLFMEELKAEIAQGEFQKILHMTARNAWYYLQQQAPINSAAQKILDELQVQSGGSLEWMKFDVPMLIAAAGASSHATTDGIIECLTNVQRTSLVRYLLAIGFHDNNSMEEALREACHVPDNTGVIGLLLKTHVFIDAGNWKGSTPLIYAAAREGTMKNIKFLLAAGANPSLATTRVLLVDGINPPRYGGEIKTARAFVEERLENEKRNCFPHIAKMNVVIDLLKRAEDAWRSGEEAKQKFMDDLKVEMAAEKLAEMNIEAAQGPAILTITTTTTTTQPQ